MYYLRRIALIPPLLLLISLAAFLLVRVAPGGPFDRDRKPASPQVRAALEAKYHLDEPVWRQYLRYLGGLVQGDLGPSLKYRAHTVNDIIAQGLPISLVLGVLAFGLAIGVGVPSGFYSAVRRGHWSDYGITLLTLVAICVPGFLIGPILVMVLAIELRWFPVALAETPWHFVLPTLSLGLFFAGKVARMMREGTLQTLQLDFINTARAKGLPETQVLLKHVLRLAILPVVSYSGPLLADLLTGSFVVENIFQIPGIGVFMVNSSLNRDYPLIVGLVLLYAVLLVVLNLVVDFFYSWLDPRVRYE